MDTAPKSLGRVDSQRVKEIRFASATIILGSVIIVLNIVCLFLDWAEIEFGAAPAAVSAAQPPNQTQVASGDLDPFMYKSTDIKMKLSFGVVSEMSGSVSTSSGASTFAANFRTATQVASFSPIPNSESLTFFHAAERCYPQERILEHVPRS